MAWIEFTQILFPCNRERLNETALETRIKTIRTRRVEQLIRRGAAHNSSQDANERRIDYNVSNPRSFDCTERSPEAHAFQTWSPPLGQVFAEIGDPAGRICHSFDVRSTEAVTCAER